MNTSKKCSHCKEEKQLDLFGNLKSSKDGKNVVCIQCRKKIYQKNKEKVSEKGKEYRLKNKKAILERNRKYRSKNKEKVAKYSKEYNRKLYDNKKEEILARNKEYRDDNIEKTKEYQRKYQKSDKMKQWHKEYRQTQKYKAIKRNIDHKRRIEKKIGDVTTQQMIDLELKSKNCYWCNISLKNKKTHIDHYVPISKGGKHTIGNLVITCVHCNLSKNSKDPIEFANEKGRLL